MSRSYAADALNITASLGLCYPSNVPVTVTPHLGEMARLTGIAIDRIKKSLCESAQNYAEAHGVICLLKDARSVISDGKTTFVNTSGTSAMAKGGSGDVLTGVLPRSPHQGRSASRRSIRSVSAWKSGRAEPQKKRNPRAARA